MTVALLFGLIGLALWFFPSAPPKIQEAGRLLFFAASLVWLSSQGSHRLF